MDVNYLDIPLIGIIGIDGRPKRATINEAVAIAVSQVDDGAYNSVEAWVYARESALRRFAKAHLPPQFRGAFFHEAVIAPQEGPKDAEYAQLCEEQVRDWLSRDPRPGYYRHAVEKTWLAKMAAPHKRVPDRGELIPDEAIS